MNLQNNVHDDIAKGQKAVSNKTRVREHVLCNYGKTRIAGEKDHLYPLHHVNMFAILNKSTSTDH